VTTDLFSGDQLPIEALVECVKREIRFRERVYARRVDERKMTPQKAAYEIQAMRQILGMLEERVGG
jgi:hypothetical protein